jgi:putative ABC transport system permease protein
VSGNTNWSTVFYGITPDYLEVREWAIAEGRGFEPAEMSGAGKVVLIGQTVAKNIFGDASPLDQVIRVRKVPLTVIGVLDRKGQSMTGQDQDDLILMPISTARKRVLGAAQAKSRSVSSIMVKVRQGADMSACANCCASAIACNRGRTTTFSCATCPRFFRPRRPHRRS